MSTTMINEQAEYSHNADLEAWELNESRHKSRSDEVLPSNKKALFDALAAAGIEIVTVNFDGYGDSGQIEDIDARRGHELVKLPDEKIQVVIASWGNTSLEHHTFTIEEAIEYFVYEFLSESHCGWCNDDGAFGDFTFDVAYQSISLDYHERYTETNFSHHQF